MSEPIISVQNLSLFYEDLQALKDITLEIPVNQVFALIGPSCCGKSTFLRVLNRMNDLIDTVKISGRVEYEGHDIYREGDVIELRRRIGLVFQKPNPFPLSIFENIAYGPRVHGVRDKKTLEEIVEQSLRKAAMWKEVKDRLNASALSLSGGQQQRLCIARALAVEPHVILMDEPTSALDPGSTAKIEELILQLKENYTIVIVTHNLHQAARVANRTAFFLEGVVVEVGDTQDIFLHPKNSETIAYINGQFG